MEGFSHRFASCRNSLELSSQVEALLMEVLQESLGPM